MKDNIDEMKIKNFPFQFKNSIKFLINIINFPKNLITFIWLIFSFVIYIIKF